MICNQTEFRLVQNELEKGIYNQNLVQFDKIQNNIFRYITLGWGTFVEDTTVECTFVEGTLVEWNIGRMEHWLNGTLVERNIGRTEHWLNGTFV